MTPVLRHMADTISARAAANDLLTADELGKLAAAIRVAANLYEPVPAIVLPFQRRPGGDNAA